MNETYNSGCITSGMLKSEFIDLPKRPEAIDL